MKITAEFNSTSEVLDFIKAFGTKTVVQLQDANVGTKKEDKKVEKKSNAVKEEVKTEDKVEVPKVEAEKVGQANGVTEIKEAEGVQEVKVTKEQVREVFTKLIKAGKQREAKELTAKYGASKIGEVKKEDYAAILKDAEELL